MRSAFVRVQNSYDHAVIGAGHNGLVHACYLARAGLKVVVLERRHVVGGAVCTEEIIPGYRFDVGSSVHIMFPMTGIAQELGLARYGLEYLEMDPWAYHPAPGGGIAFYRSVEQTCESVARYSVRDAQAYRRFVEHWGKINEGVFEVFQKPPSLGNLIGTMVRKNFHDRASRKLWSSGDTVRMLMSSYGALIDETFESREMRAAMVWLAAQSGPAPAEQRSGDFAGWQAMIHRHGCWRARGGSGMLSVALARCLKELGGAVVTDAEVSRIRRTGAREFLIDTAAGEIAADRVTAACHVHTTFLQLLDPSLRPDRLIRKVRRTRIGNGFGMVVRHAVEELPVYEDMAASGAGSVHSAMQLLCPDRDYLERAVASHAAGLPAEEPAVLGMTFSALDPSLAPPGKHTLFTWTQYHPYALANGEQWDTIAEREADKVYDVVCRYAPNMRGKMIGRFVQTPLDLERRLGLLQGNVMHLEMAFDQMFCMRPFFGMSCYRTPIRGLYITGASTHPGGGVFGASGRNAAGVVLRDLGRQMIE